jgi:hypothetical protein
MTAADIIAFASPVLLVTLAALVLRGHWWGGFIAPLQFGAVPVQVVLVMAARGAPAAQIAASTGIGVAMLGLMAVIFREEWFAHRAARAVFRWEEFEAGFRSYVMSLPPGPDGPLTQR